MHSLTWEGDYWVINFFLNDIYRPDFSASLVTTLGDLNWRKFSFWGQTCSKFNNYCDYYLYKIYKKTTTSVYIYKKDNSSL